MSRITDPRFEGIDFERSYLTGVIYDDESLSLDIDDLQIDKAKPVEGQEEDYSIIYSAAGDGQSFEFSTGWGEIKVAAGSVRIALD
jgi:hypothetical protein